MKQAGSPKVPTAGEPAAGSRQLFIERARALVPALRERAARAEELRSLPEETIRDFHETGLARILQPVRVGGAELAYGALVEVGIEIGRGCGSTSWVLTNLISHHWMLAMWPAEAQEEVWGDSPDHLICSSLVFPAGRATKVAGGYHLSGRWPFSSGVDFSGWNMLGAQVMRGDGEPPEFRMFLLRKEETKIIDTWRAAGLRGTCSNDVQVEDLFVPEHRTLAADDTKGGRAPGSAVNPAPLYRLPVLALFPYVIGSAVLGIAKGAYETYLESARRRAATYSGAKVSGYAAVQMKVAEAAASIDAAELIMRRNCDEVMGIVEGGNLPTIEERVRYRRDGAFAASLCVRAVDRLIEASGGRGFYDANPMQRAFRDVHTGAAHIALTWEVAAATYGKVAMGLPCDNPVI
jgi:3-hydroxy-9,10-secoandrosta-1,3,5(10)-triene-9,17-dione monooxygenase